MPQSTPPPASSKPLAKRQPSPHHKKTSPDLTIPGEDEDLPILTEVVSPEKKVPAERPIDAKQVRALTSEIVAAVRQQLSYELSTLIEAVLLNTSEELRVNITAIVETAVRDYLTRKFSSGNESKPL